MTVPASAVFHTSGRPLPMRHSQTASPRRTRHKSRSTRAITVPRMTVPALHWAANTHRNSRTNGTMATQNQIRPHSM